MPRRCDQVADATGPAYDLSPKRVTGMPPNLPPPPKNHTPLYTHGAVCVRRAMLNVARSLIDIVVYVALCC
jgi:hypothetical protein